ncbi:MAG TPA: site-2 protease family protein [Bacteroidetes bacterium]|nr:site-2 protease family protein [Bacteroidota bacterium]
MTSDMLALGPIWYVCFLFALTCHEAAHALAAKIGGDDTAAMAGQVSLNPLPHMQREPVGTVVVPFLSFILSGWMLGWASAPYDPVWADRYPKRAAWMALAGPVANFVLVLIAAALIHAGIAAGYFYNPDNVNYTTVVAAHQAGFWGAMASFLSITFALNLLLGFFNLLPVPPLDGNAVVGLFLSENAARKFAEFSHNPMFSLLGILLAWQVFGTVFSPIFTMALNLLYPWTQYQ